jgi:tetratricopeptide (TPR) repeat protein
VTDSEPNHRLAEVMAEAGLSNKALARRIREASTRSGSLIAADHTSVSRWLTGMQPRPRTAQLLVSILSAELGRTVRLADVGMSDVKADDAQGIEYGDEPGDALTALAALWRADLKQDGTVLAAPIATASWSQATLSWLVRSRDDRIGECKTAIRVGPTDVDAVRATTSAFAELDNRFGGGHARSALIQYLSSDLTGLLAGRYSDGVGRQLFAAGAEATLLAAWMSYDAGIHGLAQRYFIQALRLAQTADDVLLAANILDAMSHQATFLGRPREAANMARAARTGTQGRSTPGVEAHFYAMEARALASAGDEVRANHALSEATRVFERRRPGDDPEWISYFDDAELNAEFSHCLRDLNRRKDAIRYAQQALSGASRRSDLFVTIVLADAHIGPDGDPCEACRIARDALDISTKLKSARPIAYLREFRRRLEPYRTNPAVRELEDYASDNPVWQAAQP